MHETMEKTYLAGLGLMAVTYEKAEKLARQLVEKGEIAKEKQQEFINSLIKKAKRNSSQIEKIVSERIDELAEKGKPLRKKQDEIVKEISKKTKEFGVISEKNIKKIVSDIMEKGKSIKGKISGNMSLEEKVEEILKKLKVPTRRDINNINKKLDKLIMLSKLNDERKNEENIGS